MSGSRVIDKDRGWAAYFKSVSQMKSAYVKVGVLDEGKGGEKHGPDDALTVAQIAAIHEFGTEDGSIPERSFIRSTFDEQRERLTGVAKQLTTRIIAGQATTEQAMNILGSILAAEVKKKIAAGISPPNAESTARAKAAKGRTGKFFKKPAANLGDALAQVGALAAVKPLIDTGRMMNSVTWLVVLDGRGEEGIDE